MGVYLFLFLFFFMAMGIPIAFAMAMGLVATIWCWGGSSLSMLFQQIFQGVNSFTFIAVPMFILAGELMSKVGIIDDILLLCRVLVGWVPGSLANANIVASMFFAGVSGSAVADTSAIGGALIPAMVKEGYDDDCGSYSQLLGDWPHYPSQYRNGALWSNYGHVYFRYVYGRRGAGYLAGSGTYDSRHLSEH